MCEWEAAVVPQLAAYMLGFVKKIRKTQQDRDDKTMNVTCSGHQTVIDDLKRKIEDLKNPASSSTSSKKQREC